MASNLAPGLSTSVAEDSQDAGTTGRVEASMTATIEADVKLVRWPTESALRDRYRSGGVMRLLVVEAGVCPPVCTDAREDWVRAPIRQDDLQARIAALRARFEVDRRPAVDPHGVVRYGGRSATLSPTGTDLLERLARDFGELVDRNELLRHCLPDRDHDVSRNALDLHIMRVRRRIRPLGLAIRTVWGRGYLLEQAVASAARD
jgi:hypothetical protein